MFNSFIYVLMMGFSYTLNHIFSYWKHLYLQFIVYINEKLSFLVKKTNTLYFLPVRQSILLNKVD